MRLPLEEDGKVMARGDAVGANHGEMLAFRIDRDDGAQLRHEHAQLRYVDGLANVGNLAETQLGGGIDQAGIDAQALSFDHPHAFGRDRFGSDG